MILRNDVYPPRLPACSMFITINSSFASRAGARTYSATAPLLEHTLLYSEAKLISVAVKVLAVKIYTMRYLLKNQSNS